MKKSLRKLALNRETLQTLETPLALAQGGEIQPALNTIDLIPRTQLCRTRYCPQIETAYCTVGSLGSCTEPTLTF